MHEEIITRLDLTRLRMHLCDTLSINSSQRPQLDLQYRILFTKREQKTRS